MGLQLLSKADLRVFHEVTKDGILTLHKITTDILILIIYGCLVFFQKVWETSRKFIKVGTFIILKLKRLLIIVTDYLIEIRYIYIYIDNVEILSLCPTTCININILQLTGDIYVPVSLLRQMPIAELLFLGNKNSFYGDKRFLFSGKLDWFFLLAGEKFWCS